MDLFLTGITVFFIFFTGLIPFPVLYFFTDIMRFILQRLAGYRKKVIVSNLQGAFPGLEGDGLERIVDDVYRNLADVLAEGVKGFTIRPAVLRKRHFIVNAAEIEPWLAAGKSIITLPGHVNNFEWGSMSPGLFTTFPVLAFYKPLSNPYLNRFLKRSRAKFGTTLVSIGETSEVFRRNASTPSVYVMAADQSPSKPDKAIWVPFFGRETAFLHGPEKYARMYHFPVFYVDIIRVKRGYYTLNVELLADDPAGLAEGELTARYASRLEKSIKESPGSWLWSHKRWKLSRPVHGVDQSGILL
jgi:KDO2-lipid IV(A) lauroyltransferase